VRRARAVAAAAVLSAGLAATLAALAGRPSPSFSDPQVDARADGCGRDYLAETRRDLPTWVYVNDRDAPASGPPPKARLLRGVVSSRYQRELAVHPTPEDLPTIHRAYDFNFDLLPDRADSYLLGGDRTLGTGNFAGRTPEWGRVHVEREQLALARFAWPEVGDRVTLLGSWVWDCGHWTPGGERTEIHSYRALWLQRSPGRPSPLSPFGESEGDLFISSDKTYAGIEADCAHRTKGDSSAFRNCLATEPVWQDVSGTYDFSLPVPRRPVARARLVVRVVDAGSTPGTHRARATVRAGRVDVSLTVSGKPGRRLVVAQRVLVRWSRVPARALPEHLRIHFVRLLVRRAMDPGCPGGRRTCGSKETTHGEQVTAGPGEWNVYMDAAGIWKVWGSGLLGAHDGQVFRNGPAIDLYLAPDRPWRLFVFTRECDFGALGNADGPLHGMSPCPPSNEFGTFDGDDVPGMIVKRFASPAASLGLHRGHPLRLGSTCPAVNRLGCYELDYRVERVRDEAARARWR
jgi:hypothetical protein